MPKPIVAQSRKHPPSPQPPPPPPHACTARPEHSHADAGSPSGQSVIVCVCWCTPCLYYYVAGFCQAGHTPSDYCVVIGPASYVTDVLLVELPRDGRLVISCADRSPILKPFPVGVAPCVAPTPHHPPLSLFGVHRVMRTS